MKTYERSPYEAVTLERVFTPAECQKIIAYSESLGLEEGKAYRPYAETIEEVNHKIRVAQSVVLPHNDDTAWINDRARKMVEEANQQFEFEISETYPLTLMFVKYPTGGHFGFHVDNLGNVAARKISCSIQLSPDTDYTGGDLIMYEGREYADSMCTREQGSATVFPSFVFHKVRKVFTGTRYALVVWAFGDRHFK